LSVPQLADDIWKFVMENGIVIVPKEHDPSGEFTFERH
jgi:hypothetical protein